MNDKDLKELNDYRKKQEEYITKLANEFTKIYNLNSTDRTFTLSYDANGPLLRTTSPITPDRASQLMPLEGGTKWEFGTYNLDGYPKTGLWSQVNGKMVFLPVDQEIDNSKVNVVKNPVEFASLLVAKNPHLQNKINIVRDGEIEVIGQIHGADLPSTDWQVDENTGWITSTIMPDVKFHMTFISAHEKTMNGEELNKATENFSYDTNLKTGNVSYSEEKEESQERFEEDENLNLNRLGQSFNSGINIQKMRYAEDNYIIDTNGHVQLKENGYSQVKPQEEKNNEDLAGVLIFNNILKVASCKALGLDMETAVNIDINAVFNDAQIESLLKAMESVKGVDLSQIVDMLFSSSAEFKGEAGRTAIYVLCDDSIAQMIGINRDISLEEALNKLNSLENESLKDQFNEMMRNISDAEMEDDTVMEMMMNGQNNNN